MQIGTVEPQQGGFPAWQMAAAIAGATFVRIEGAGQGVSQRLWI